MCLPTEFLTLKAFIKGATALSPCASMLTTRISKWFLLIQRKEDQNDSNGQKDENDCPIVKLFCFHLVGKSRGLKEGQIDSERYELLAPDKKKTCKRQNKKSWHPNGDLDKWMVWKGAASVHGRIEIETAWDTIIWAQCNNRNAGHKNADDDKQNEIFFGEIHILWSIVSTLFRDLFKSFSLIPTLW